MTQGDFLLLELWERDYLRRVSMRLYGICIRLLCSDWLINQLGVLHCLLSIFEIDWEAKGLVACIRN